MPAEIHTDIIVVIDKQTGQVDLTADSNRLKFFKFEEEDARHRRILLMTIPAGRMSKLMEEKMGWVAQVGLRLREASAKRPAG